jgi:N-acetyl-anhydromuramyl-L-alanine amidase AmpD
MNIIKDFLPLNEYFPTNQNKRWICIHHTVGYSAKSSIEGWRRDPNRVGTAYVIDRDGIIYQAFNDAHYAYQFGLSNVQRRMEFEQGTIGIELANLGGLKKLQNGQLADEYGRIFKGSFTRYKFRGYEYWEDYTPEQYIALKELIASLCLKHDIKANPSRKLDFDMSVFDKHTIITHTNCRRDKTDLSPAFDWEKIFPQT